MAWSAASLYELLVGRFLPTAGPQEVGEVPTNPDDFKTTAA